MDEFDAIPLTSGPSLSDGNEQHERPVTCHFCRVSTSRPTYPCLTCKKFFCLACLERQTPGEISNAQSGQFTCTVCRGTCCCVHADCTQDHVHCYTYMRKKIRSGELAAMPRRSSTPSTNQALSFLNTAVPSKRNIGGYFYVHATGTEPNFAEIQAQNRRLVQDLTNVDYLYFAQLFTSWNLRTSALAVENTTTLGKHYAVEYLGPFVVYQALVRMICHGCGGEIRKGDHWCAHTAPQWQQRPFCMLCVRYVLLHLQAQPNAPLVDQRDQVEGLFDITKRNSEVDAAQTMQGSAES